MAQYRRPFAEPGEGRRPTLTWPREILVEGEPADVVAIVAAYADWLATSSVPKLFMKAEPSGILAEADLDVVRKFPAQTEVTAGGIHYVQEAAAICERRNSPFMRPAAAGRSLRVSGC